MKRIIVLIITFLALGAQAQQGVVRGRVTDARTSENIEYATVALLSPKDSTLKGGTVTDGGGHFKIEAPYGRYLLRITFVGYEPQYYKNTVTLSAEHPSANLGKVAINPRATTMEAVEITAERSMVEYQLDKRVVNVDKNIVAGGGTATDVLEQVPSVAIDNDGNVTLRGSSNVKVLVNGRPSELLASDLATLLEQIPASTVENVEVITNPSAKYDPEGMSGIINIKLKDKTAGALGLNGVVNLNVGAPLPFMVPDSLPPFIPTAMGNISLNYTTEKYNLFFNADAGLRQRGSKSTSDIENRPLGAGSIPTHNDIEQYSLNPNLMGSVKVGGEYYFDDKNSLLLSYQLRGGNRRRNSSSYATDLLYNDSLHYTQIATSDNHNTNHSFNLLYTKKFDRKDEELTFDATFSTRQVQGNGVQEQTYADLAANYANYYKRTSLTENHHQALNIKLNWLRPLDSFLGKDGWRLESGYEGRMDWPDQRADYYRTVFDTTTSPYEYYGYYDSLSSTHFNYRQQVHAVYATLGGNITEALSLQGGLRGEYAHIFGKDINHPNTAAVDKPYWQLYPTLHLSYKITDLQSAQISYSRRVRRPHMWDLNPFLDIREDNQMSFGNPNLDPEYTNAFELSYNLGIKKVNIFTSLYYRQTNNMITHYGFTWCQDSVDHYAWWEPYNSQYDGYRASTRLNLSTGYNYGMEFIVDWQIFQWWKINVSVNFYQSHIEGTELLHNQSSESFQASGKFSSFMTLSKDWTIQLSGQYWAPWLDLQTQMDPNYWVDLAVKKDVFNKRGTVNLRVSDVFCTGGWGHTTYSATFNRVFKSRRLSPTVTVGFTWKINNGLKQRQQQDMDDDGGENNVY
ncbi:MAG: TonB-dependent receptor family protein [Bacteroidales bacterium]|nr:TonB-dependent receptor family protein [Bacteroidales bacterium]